jgi:proteic killer suppression protein
MINSFADQTTSDIYNGINSKLARKIPISLHRIAARKLDMINAASQIEDLRAPPSNHLEMLKGDLAGKYSIRINDQYRIVFVWVTNNAEQVTIIDYH